MLFVIGVFVFFFILPIIYFPFDLWQQHTYRKEQRRWNEFCRKNNRDPKDYYDPYFEIPEDRGPYPYS